MITSLRRRRSWIAVVAALAAAGCRDHPDRFVSTDTVATDAPAMVSLAADRTALLESGEVTVVASFAPDVPSASIGAFTARLAYDTAHLEFLPARSEAAGVGAMFAQHGVVKAAAAAPSGFAKRELFTARFRALHPERTAERTVIGTLRLTLDEVSGVDFSNRLPPDSVRRTFIVR